MYKWDLEKEWLKTPCPTSILHWHIICIEMQIEAELPPKRILKHSIMALTRAPGMPVIGDVGVHRETWSFPLALVAAEGSS